MNFNEAIQKIIEGKKIRRNCWNDGNYWFLCDKHILNSNGDNPIINKKQLESDDWELFKEEKVLKNIKLGNRNNHLLVIETWQIGNILKLEEKEVSSIRDYLLSLGNFKEINIEENFYLSDKIIEEDTIFNKSIPDGIIRQNDVKEFIKIVKRDIKRVAEEGNGEINWTSACAIIDNNAGSKLI